MRQHHLVGNSATLKPDSGSVVGWDSVALTGRTTQSLESEKEGICSDISLMRMP